MFKVSFMVFLIFLLNGCREKVQLENENFDFSPGKIIYLDSVALDEEGSSFNFVFNPKVYQDSLLVFGDGSFSTVHLYNLKRGNKIQSYSQIDSKEYPLPSSGFTNSFIENETIFLLNFMTNKIYSFDFEGNFLSDLELELKDDFKFNFQTFFERINNSFFISQRIDAPLKERFEKGEMLASYSSNGLYLKSFGKYPKNYSEGNLALIRSENIIKKADDIFIINSVGVPILKRFDLEGNLKEFYELKSNYFDPTLFYFIESPFDSSPMDQIISLASDQSKPDLIFYLAYVHFKEKEKDDLERNFQLMLMKVDLENHIIKESELVGPWYYLELRTLIPNVNNDTLSFLVRGKDENLYLKRFLFD